MTLPRTSLPGLLAAMLFLPATVLPAEPPATDARGQATPDDAKEISADKSEGRYRKPDATKFIQVVRNEKGEATALQTAIVSYVPVAEKDRESVTVDLVAAVHVGDRSYYRELNERFEKYDVLLYELVAPEGTRVPKGGRGGGVITLVKNVLELESQVERIDYTKENFVHADMSPKQMAELMEKRGETGFTLALSVISDMLRQQQTLMQRPGDGKTPDVDLFTFLFDPNRSVKLKRAMAVQFESLDESGGLGETLGRLLITDRNKAAMKVLEKQLAAGKKRIAIFYGGAHMPDFEKRLLAEFGLKRKSAEWLTAWDLNKK